MRETEAGGFDTPERRAAFEARIGEVTAAIGDDTVRKYYRQEFGDRLRRLFEVDERPQYRRGPARTNARPGGSWQSRARSGGRDRFGANRGRPMPVVGSSAASFTWSRARSWRRARSSADRAAIPHREALILQAAINHPWLLHDHLEELAGFEFRHPDAGRLKAALVDIVAQDAEPDREAMRAELGRRGLADLVGRIERSITIPSVWGARPEAAPDDVLMTWKQLIALHRQWHSLIKELKDAEQALGQDPTEANYSWLQDVKARLSVIDGTEALIEGFGASSGRTAQGF